MKTINLTDIKIDEVIIRPNEVITILYSILDDEGQVIQGKVASLKYETLSTQEKTVITSLTNRFLTKTRVSEKLE